MECSLSVEALKALRSKVAKDVLVMMEKDQNFDLKKYMNSVYKLVYNRNESHIQALDAAKMIPSFAYQITAADSSIRKHLSKSKVDFNELIELQDSFEDTESGVKAVEDFLDLSQTNEKVEVLKQLNETNNTEQTVEEQQEQDKETELESEKIYQESLKALDQVETGRQRGEGTYAGMEYETLNHPDFPELKDVIWYKGDIKPTVLNDGTVVPYGMDLRDYVMEKYAIDQDIALEKEEEVEDVKQDAEIQEELKREALAEKQEAQTEQQLDAKAEKLVKAKEQLEQDYKIPFPNGTIDVIIDSTYDDKLTLTIENGKVTRATQTITERTDIPQSVNIDTYVATEKVTVKEINAKEAEDILRDYATRPNKQSAINYYPVQLAKQEVRQETKPTPQIDPSRQNYLAKATYAIREKIAKLWNAVVPTFLSTSGLEASYYYSKNKGEANFRVPYEETNHFYGSQRSIIKLLQDANIDNDGSKLDLGREFGGEGVFIKAVRLDQLNDYPSNIKDLLLKANPDTLMMTFVNSFGETINFDEDFNPVVSGGKPAYQPMRSVNDASNKKNSRAIKAEMAKSYYNSTLKAGVVQGGYSKQKYAAAMAKANAYVQDQWNKSAKIEKYLKDNPTGNLRFNLTGGSMGYIATSQYVLSNLKDVKGEVQIETATKSDPTRDMVEGITYVTSSELHGQMIRVEQPGLVESEDINFVKQLLFEPIKDIQGKVLSLEKRQDQLQNYLNVKNKGNSQGSKLVLMNKTDDGWSLTIADPVNGYKIFDISKTQEKAQAEEAFDRLLNEQELAIGKGKQVGSVRQNEVDQLAENEIAESVNQSKPNQFIPNNKIDAKDQSGQYTKVVSKLKTNINVSGENINTGKITRLADGTLEFTEQKVPVKEFLSKQNFRIGTPDLASDGKLRKTNSYVTFDINDSTAEKLDKPVEEKVKEQEEAEERNEEVNKQAEEQNKEDRFKEFDNDDYTDELFTSKVAAANKSKATKQQIAKAKEWYSNHPLSKVFPFETMFNVTNKDGVAQWTMAGMTLFKGSDFSDIYHEAFHGFSQGFLSPQQREELYAEARRKKGTFTDYNGKDVTFKDATNKQIEEYLAFEFREFMLSKGNTKKTKVGKKTLNFFQKILKALEYFFTDASYTEVYTNPLGNSKIKEVFENLKVGNLKSYNFSLENAEFGKLNSGITVIESNATSTAKKGVQQINYQDSMVINDMIDNFIAEYAVLKSTNKLDRERIQDIQAKLTGKISMAERAELVAEEAALKQGVRYMGMLTQSPKLMEQAYGWALKELSLIKDQLNIDYLKSTDATEKARLFRDKELLEFAIENFSNVKGSTKISDNKTKSGEVIRGVISHHLSKTGLFNTETLLENEEIDEATVAEKDRLSSQSGNEISLIELSKPEVIFLLKTLPNIQNGVEVKNRFGVTELAPFNATWNRLARALQNTHDFDAMYSKLQDLALEYEPIKTLIDRLGDPSASTLASEHNLQSAFFQTFAKTRVPLIQHSLEGNQSRVGEAFNSDSVVGKRWQGNFAAALPNTNPYILTDNSGNYLNTAKILKDFPLRKAISDPLSFYKAIGFNFTDTKEISQQIKQPKYNPTYVHEYLQKINEGKSDIKEVRDLGTLMEAESPLYKSLQNLESRYSDVFSNFAVTNAEGNMQFEHTLNNSMSIMVNSINNAPDYLTLISAPHMAHLNIETNPFAESSLWLKSLFKLDLEKSNPEYGKPRYYKNSRVTLDLVNLSGINVREKDASSEGVASASADKFAKLIMDIHLNFAGKPELMRHADKGTSYSVTISGNFEGQGKATDNYIPIQSFKNKDYELQTYNRLIPHILAEVKRITQMTELNELNKKGELKEDLDYEYIARGMEFAAFDNVLRTSTKDQLKKLGVTKETTLTEFENILSENRELRGSIQKDLNDYFEKQFEKTEAKAKEADYIGDNVLKEVQARTGLTNQTEQKKALVRSYVHNNWIHNIESIALLYGDLAQYNNAKEGFHKRNAGIGSTGTIFRTDTSMINHINNNLYKTSYAAQAGFMKNIPQRMFNGQFNTGIIVDQDTPAAYKKELKDVLGDKIGDYEGGQNEADAQAFISFDSYRQLKTTEGTWSNEHEKLFQKSVKGEEITPRDIVKFFPVIKGQYWGPLANTNNGIPITAFHKYSLFPMIPGVAKGKTMQKVQERMMKEGIDYITFESGSKVGNVTKSGSPLQQDGTGGRRNFDKLYTSQNNRTLEQDLIEDKFDGQGQLIPYFTKNTIHLEYLKNQLSIYDEAKGSVIFSTQLRKLIEDGLMEEGVPIDFIKDGGTKKEWDNIKSEQAKESKSPYYKMLRTYERNLSKLTQIAKDKLLEEMNWEEQTVNGKKVLKGDIKNLIAFVKKELTRQDLAQHEIDFIEYDENGNLKRDISYHLSVERIEKLLNALMVKKLVKQKVNGEGLIQVASTLMEDLSSTEGRNFDNPTEEELKKFGSNDLPFYREGKGKDGATSAMKVKVALQGDFVNLLQMTHLDNQPIGDRQRLNEMIKDDDWLDTGRNREMVTMVGVRIPVQGLNSMEFMEVYEFLDPSAGSVIVPPTEIVTKSGADFDVDKMTVMMPSIRKAKYEKGEFGFSQKVADPQMWNWTKEELDQEYKEYLDFQQKLQGLDKNIENDLLIMRITGQTTEELDAEKKEEFEELINNGEVLSSENFKKKRLGSKAVENDLIMNIKDILALPTNFKSLVTPNSTDILDPLVEEFRESAREDDMTDVIYAEEGEQKRKGPKGNNVMSHTRALEIGYNLGKHGSNSVGKATLGLGAVDNTYNTLFNRIGAHMSPGTVRSEDMAAARAVIKDKTSSKKAKEEANKLIDSWQPQKLLVPHNTIQVDGQKAISLSGLKDADGTNSISDVINQLINGWVDIAANDFIFDLQGNKETASTLLFMMQAGVPIRTAIAVVSSPLVKEYIATQQRAASVLRTKTGFGPQDANKAKQWAKDNVINKHIDQGDLKLNDEGYYTRASLATVTQNVNGGKAFTKQDIENIIKSTKNQRQTKNQGKTYVPTSLDIEVFKHFLEIENMADPIGSIKMTTNVDTSRDVSLYDAQQRLGKVAGLKEDGRIPKSMIDGLMNNSPIGSFFIQDFQVELLGQIFPARNAKEINNYVRDNITSAEAKNLFGKKDITVQNWKGDFINFVFQNELTYFDIDNTDYYKSRSTQVAGKEASPALLERGAFVKNGVLYYDKAALIRQYDSSMYTSREYNSEYGLALINGKVFERPEQYFQFAFERETLRDSYPLKDIQSTVLFKEKLNQVKNSTAFTQTENESSAYNNKRKVKYAYELWLRDTALNNLYNFNQMFTLKDVNYGSRFIRLREEYPELAKSFQLMNALSFDNPKEGNRKNLFLNERELGVDQKNILHENIMNLQSFEKVREVLPDATVAQINEINDFFSKMPIVGFMQSGMNTKSQYALTQFLPQDKMYSIIAEPMKNFNNGLATKSNDPAIKYLDLFTKQFKTKNASSKRKSRIRGKDYSNNVTLSLLHGPSLNQQMNSIKDAIVAPLLQPGFEYGVMDISDSKEGQLSLFKQETTEPQYYEGNITPEKDTIFVFGSNPIGVNGNPKKYPNMSASVATTQFGVKQGEIMDNRLSDSGDAYGLVTVKGPGQQKSLTHSEISTNIAKMYQVARENPTKKFKVAYRKGRNNNGYTTKEMIRMFNDGSYIQRLDAQGDVEEVLEIPSNVIFSKEYYDQGNFNFEAPKQTPSQEAITGTVNSTEYEALLYSTGDLERSQLKNTLENHPDKSFVYNGSLKAEAPLTGRKNSEKLHGLAKNAIGITTKMSYSMEAGKVRSDEVRDVDGKINPEVKESIDANIKNIREHVAQGQTLAFDRAGYGQDMIVTQQNGNQNAPQTFVYLSEQLYKNFGYVNPGYLNNSLNNATVKESVARLQENQNITDKEINRTIDNYSDKDVIEFMKNCI